MTDNTVKITIKIILFSLNKFTITDHFTKKPESGGKPNHDNIKVNIITDINLL